MSSLISTTTPLALNATYTSAVSNINRATQITGSVYADQPGTLYIDQGGDGTNFDCVTQYYLDGLSTTVVDIDIICQYLRVRYVNGPTPQTVFRLYIDIRDPWGEFLSNLPPSPGGTFITLYYNPSTQMYEVVARFNATNGMNANSSAALLKNRNGKYASFAVTDAVVTQETIQGVTDQAPDSF